MADGLTEDQFELFQVLLKSFEKIGIDKINLASRRMFDKFLQDTGFHDRSYVFPILKKKDLEEGKPKSAITLPYSLEIYFASKQADYPAKFINFSQSIQGLNTIDDFDVPCNLVLVDDFVGTGDSVFDFLQENNELIECFDANIVIIATACLGAAKARIEEAGHTIFADKILIKAIEENDLIADKAKAYEVYNEIESLVKISKRYTLGYKKSEALVSLINTPNNTLPIFWADTKKDGETWPSMFPRRRVVAI